MRSLIQTGASLLLKVHYPSTGKEKVIGFARGLTYSVSQGQKSIHVVDTPFPAEIAQGAAPSFVKGGLTCYLPSGSTPESAGLVPYRTNEDGAINMAGSKYLNFRIYDRLSNQLVMSCDYCKVSSYSVSIVARGIVECSLQFDGILLTPGQTI